MKIWDTVFDNHMHLREDGFSISAAKEFEKSGGTAFNLVNLPNYSIPAKDYYQNIYGSTLKMAERVRKETGIKVLVTIGPYPLDYVHFKETVCDINQFVKNGIDLAIEIIENGEANALGEIGRPHFETDEITVSDANKLLEYAMERCSKSSIPIILHTEDLSADMYSGLAGMARSTGFNTDKLIKHHAYPQDLALDNPLRKSILATRRNVREALVLGKEFFLETDYVDDREKPGKVIPADSVPRRALMIRNEYEEWEEIFDSIFRRLPFQVYGEDAFL